MSYYFEFVNKLSKNKGELGGSNTKDVLEQEIRDGNKKGVFIKYAKITKKKGEDEVMYKIIIKQIKVDEDDYELAIIDNENSADTVKTSHSLVEILGFLKKNKDMKFALDYLNNDQKGVRDQTGSGKTKTKPVKKKSTKKKSAKKKSAKKKSTKKKSTKKKSAKKKSTKKKSAKKKSTTKKSAKKKSTKKKSTKKGAK